jgi:AAA domain
MLTKSQKNSILEAIENERVILGSYTKVSTKIDIATATITNNMKNQHRWSYVSDSMWSKAAHALGVTFETTTWNIVDTTNSKLMESALKLAQTESMFIAISEKAGSGKTAGIRKYKMEDESNAVFNLQCQEWTKKQFMINLSQHLGITLRTNETLAIGNQVIEFMKERASVGKPLLILDEADKLRPSALRYLIHFYNLLEDECGLVICGTENLEKEIKRGVQKALKGYDEIDSRLGRKFINLVGITHQDVVNICSSNGITEPLIIGRIWDESEAKDRLISGKYVQVVSDLRRLKRLIQRERKKLNLN